MQKYKSNITTTSGAAIRSVPVHVLDETGNPAALFLDRAGTVAATNPLITSADGTFYFYATNGRYSLRTTVEGASITDTDVVLLMDPEELTVAGPIAEAIQRAEAAAQLAEATVADSGIPDLVEAAQNAVADAGMAVGQAQDAKTQAEASAVAAAEAKEVAESAVGAASTALTAAQQLVATNSKVLRVYATMELASADLPNLVTDQVVEVTADESRAGKKVRYTVQAGGLVFVEYGPLDELADPEKGAAMVASDGGTVQDALNFLKPLSNYAALQAYSGPALRAQITGVMGLAKPEGIAGSFSRVSANGRQSNGGTFFLDANGNGWQRDHVGPIYVEWFGAKGDDDQTLYSTNYATDVTNSPTTITQQTADGLAINRAILELRRVGGGTLAAGLGVFRIYGYLERIDFPLTVMGLGIDQTIFKSCDSSPTDRNGYGIFCISPTGKYSEVSLRSMTVDGNGHVRPQPTSEWRSHNIAYYNKINAHLDNVKSINSPIDCLITDYTNSTSGSLRASNCVFDTAYRNSVSLVSGWNQQYVNCQFLGGGKVRSGTNPRYCLDIEPRLATLTIKNLQFSNCYFANATNVLAGGVWAGGVKFTGCTFYGTGSEVASYPWLANFSGSQVDFIGCLFKGREDLRINKVSVYNELATGEYAKTQYVAFKNCNWDGAGLHGIGGRIILRSCEAENSRFPFLFETSSGTVSLDIDSLSLMNVIDALNFGAGSTAAFAVKSSVRGAVDISRLRVEFNPDRLPSDASALFDVSTMVFGIHYNPTPSATVTARMTDAYAGGWYNKYPTLFGKTLNGSNYRDWGIPNLPPADTTATTIGTGVIGTAKQYRQCTMYGNFA